MPKKTQKTEECNEISDSEIVNDIKYRFRHELRIRYSNAERLLKESWSNMASGKYDIAVEKLSELNACGEFSELEKLIIKTLSLGNNKQD